MTNDKASQVVADLLRGESIVHVEVNDIWAMFFSNDLWLLAQEIRCLGERELGDILATHAPHLLSGVDPQNVPRVALLYSFTRHLVTACSVLEDGQLSIQFGVSRELILPSDTDIVDWQWCLSKSCADPYHAKSIVACIAKGAIE